MKTSTLLFFNSLMFGSAAHFGWLADNEMSWRSNMIIFAIMFSAGGVCRAIERGDK
jgi:hypothetical protein